MRLDAVFGNGGIRLKIENCPISTETATLAIGLGLLVKNEKVIANVITDYEKAKVKLIDSRTSFLF